MNGIKLFRKHLRWQYICDIFRRAIRNKYVFDASVIAIICFLSLRVYLLGNGFYDYSDVNWPLSSALSPPGFAGISPLKWGTLDAQGFTRNILTWPYFIAMDFRLNPVMTEKLSILSLLASFLIIAYFFATKLVSTLVKITGTNLTFWKEEGIKLVTVLFLYANFETSNLMVDGGLWSDVQILMLMAISVLTLSQSRVSGRKFMLIGAFLSLTLLLDPVYYPLFVISILATSISSGLLNRNLVHRLSHSLLSISISVIVAIYVLFLLESGLTSLAIRTSTESSLVSFSANISFFNVIKLIGYSWSNMTFAPPSVLFLSPSMLHNVRAIGSPSQVILPPSFLTSLWLTLTNLIPVIAMISLLSVKLKKLTIPAFVNFALAVYLSQSGSIPMLYITFGYASHLPLIGEAIGTALAIPDRFLMLITISYSIMIPTTIFYIMQAIDSKLRSLPVPQFDSENCWPSKSMGFIRMKRLRSLNHSTKSSSKMHRDFRSNVFVLLLFSLLIFIILLSYWQAFNGDFFPSRSYPPYNPPNGVPDSAPFAPVSISSDIINTYNWLYQAKGNSSVIFPSILPNTSGKAVGLFTGQDSPRPLADAPSLPFLIKDNLRAYIVDYLRSLNVGYLVIFHASKEALLSDYGLSSWRALLNFLNGTPGIKLAHRIGNVFTYAVSGDFGKTHFVTNVLDYGGSSPLYAEAYTFYEELNSTVAVVSHSGIGSPLSIDRPSQGVSLYTPSLIAQSASMAFHSNLSSKPYSNIYWNQSNGPYSLNAWTIANWGQATVTGHLNGTFLSLSASQYTSASVSYNGTLTSSPGGVYVPADHSYAIARISFYYEMKPNYSGNLSVYLNALNSTLAGLGGQSYTIPYSQTWQYVNLTFVVPYNARYFNIRLFSNQQLGAVDFKNISMGWNYFIGSYFNRTINSTAVLFNSSARYIYLRLAGNGSVNRINFSSCSYEWVILNNETKGLIFTGNVSISAIMVMQTKINMSNHSTFAVYSMPYLPHLVAISGSTRSVSIATYEDQNLFANVSKSNLTILWEPESLIYTMYPPIVGYIGTLAIFSTSWFWKHLHAVRRRSMSRH